MEIKYLITIYKAIFMSKIQYSMLAYQVTSNSTKNKLQTMQNAILRRILRTPAKTSTKLIHTLTNISPIDIRLKNLTIKYISSARINNNKNITDQLENFVPPKSKRNHSILESLWPTNINN